MDRKFSRQYRLKHKEDITRIFGRGRRVSDKLIAVRGLPGPDETAVARLAVAVSKRHGNAVYRNHIKRLSREAFRLVRDRLPAGWDYVIIPHRGTEFTVSDLQDSIIELVGKLTADGEKRPSK